MSWDFNRFSSRIKPRERVVSSRLLASIRITDGITHAPADIRGQV
jgi:hypothetical protein